MKTIVSEKGQITIPKAVRERLGLVPGTVLDIDTAEGRLVGTKSEPLDVFTKWRGRGVLPGEKTVDEYLAAIRG